MPVLHHYYGLGWLLLPHPDTSRCQ